MNTEQFIKQFASEDVHTLALKSKSFPDVDMPYALNQILGRQKAQKKLPAWASLEGVVYPPHISMEQCSSEFTALYKKKTLDRILGYDYTLTDLTGGFGVDFMYMSEGCSKAVYVERNKELCATVEQNSILFGRNNAEFINEDSEHYIQRMTQSDVIYADPARRDSKGGRTYAISDCTPDIISLLPQLLEKGRYVLLKLSPMLDHGKTVNDLNNISKCVKEVHIVSVANECKELLLLLSKDATDNYTIYCVNDNDELSFTYSVEKHITPEIVRDTDFIGMYLYEPNASIMKAGCFSELSSEYNIQMIARNSNLFVSRGNIKNFPGRSFRVLSSTTMNKKELSRAIAGIKKANITVRNFPMSVADLRKKLKIGDGGDHYIFATTTSDGVHILLICEKVS